MMRRIVLAASCLFLGLVSLSSQALTYVPMTDESLLEQSPVVVLGQVTAVGDSAVLNRAVTEYELAVLQVVKGEVPASSIMVQTPGSTTPGSRRHWFPGMPSFSEGQTLLLFLQPKEDGSYGIMQLALGAFSLQRDALGNAVFVRELADTLRLNVAPPRANARAEQPRPAGQFLSELGGLPELDSLLPSSGRQTANFTTMSSPPSRWFEFDAGQDVPFLANTSGQPGMTGGGFNEVQSAIAAWNNDGGSNIRYRYAGKTSINADFDTNDGQNVILFDDPNGDVDGSFDCNSGGVLAAGGFISSIGTRQYNGRLFAEILEADIVTNDGAGCFFASANGQNGEEVFGHELGHTLGLGHSCGDSTVLDDCNPLLGDATAQDAALMRAYPHADGRGAALGSDDRAGAAFLYGSGSEEPTGGGDDGDGGRVTPEEPGTDNGGGGNNGGGGGGCAVSTGGPVDPLLWLLCLLSFSWLLRVRLRA